MADNDIESSEAFQLRNPKLQRRKQQKDSEGDDENEEDEEGKQRGEDELKRVIELPAIELQTGKLLSSERRQEADTGGSNLETLAVHSSLESSGNDQCADLQGNCATQMASEAESKDPHLSSDKEIIIREAVQAAQSETEKENQLQVSLCPASLSKVSPTSVSQSLSTTPTTVPEQRLPPLKVNILNVPAVDKKNHSGGKTLSAVSVARSPASDGYNWRKYGQKQVKSPTGSRSYYRCTHSACCAKKIECCDNSGHVIEIVYRSQHSHDPPRKNNSTRENKSLSSNEPAIENSVPEQHISVLNDADPSSSSKGPQQGAPCTAEKKQQNSHDLSENGKVISKEEHVNEPETKKRMKKGDLAHPGSPAKVGKKPKFVVHAAGDVGISGDGYRWRKYGQKMVKGNPHPRNYYRCTSAGCPVRKHIETAVDNSDAVIITYKGVHDHDMPVPKKRHGPPSAPLMAAAAPASMNNSQFKKSDSLQKQKTSTQWSVDTEGELTGEALELGGEKAIESARTLLSIGFEIKPC